MSCVFQICVDEQNEMLETEEVSTQNHEEEVVTQSTDECDVAQSEKVYHFAWRQVHKLFHHFLNNIVHVL